MSPGEIATGLVEVPSPGEWESSRIKTVSPVKINYCICVKKRKEVQKPHGRPRDGVEITARALDQSYVYCVKYLYYVFIC